MNIPLGGENAPVRLLVAWNQTFTETSAEWIAQAPDRDMWVVAARDQPNYFTIAAPDFGGRARINLRSAKLKRTVTNRPLPHWGYYPAGMIMMLAMSGKALPGMNIVLLGDEPQGPGFDYASALVFGVLWHTIYQQPYKIEQLIELVNHVRRDYIGDVP